MGKRDNADYFDRRFLKDVNNTDVGNDNSTTTETVWTTRNGVNTTIAEEKFVKEVTEMMNKGEGELVVTTVSAEVEMELSGEGSVDSINIGIEPDMFVAAGSSEVNMEDGSGGDQMWSAAGSSGMNMDHGEENQDGSGGGQMWSAADSSEVNNMDHGEKNQDGSGGDQMWSVGDENIKSLSLSVSAVEVFLAPFWSSYGNCLKDRDCLYLDALKLQISFCSGRGLNIKTF